MRGQAQIDREASESERELARQPPDPRVHLQRLRLLRRQLSDTAAALAAAEEELAGIYDQLAARDPAQASDYHHRAAETRTAASQAREIERQIRDRHSIPGPGAP